MKNCKVVQFVFGDRAIPKRVFKEFVNPKSGEAAFLKQQKYAWKEVEKWKPLAYTIAIKKFGDTDKEELVAEIGLLCLSECAVTYDSSSGWTFQAYASRALKRKAKTVCTALRVGQSRKCC